MNFGDDWEDGRFSGIVGGILRNVVGEGGKEKVWMKFTLGVWVMGVKRKCNIEKRFWFQGVRKVW
ncbi:hypothetical protein, partial [Siminovitchia fortis]|uniref:hypothetical protein n=1 Tax=Siminovitchia fortis TaxID=254758 RepID=UPI001C92E6F6